MGKGGQSQAVRPAGGDPAGEGRGDPLGAPQVPGAVLLTAPCAAPCGGRTRHLTPELQNPVLNLNIKKKKTLIK